MLWIIAGIITSYLLGSIPTAYIFGRVLKGIDIRQFGSGNVGATNALRVLGKGPGITVLLLDLLKGFIAVVFLGDLVGCHAISLPCGMIRIILGVACICGHNWTIFLKFKGGKGVATTLGVLLGLSLRISCLNSIFILVILTWLAVFLVTKLISLASIISGIALPVYMFFLTRSMLLTSLGILLCIFMVLRHKSNIRRIIRGEEPRMTFESKK
jgi:glycerol-3-phosphate acyltransferase PlsY